jgi:histidinol dehydrogenase
VSAETSLPRPAGPGAAPGSVATELLGPIARLASLRRVRLAGLSTAERRELVHRSAGTGADVRGAAREIIEAVRARGDDAVRELGARVGGAWTDGMPAGAVPGTPVPIAVPPERLRAETDALPHDLRAALELMARNIETFHRVQVPAPAQWVDVSPGIRVGRVWRPLDRVGIYVPGGEAAYPSSLIMGVVPARLAGVGAIAVASPAGRDGRISPVLLGTAGLLGVDEFYAIGGAQAIAALAVGTGTVAAVDGIVGPGNAWVTAAKLEVLGDVGIDMPAGPSEVMVLADATADPAHVAADLLSQAEHGPDSPAVLVATDEDVADRVEAEIARRLPAEPRVRFLATSLGSAGLVVIASGLDDGIDFVNEYAPEHLSVAVAAAEDLLPRIRHAGSVFLGAWAPESAGDYATGSNHVLPTGRLARARGPLAVEDFGHWMQAQVVDREGLASIAAAVSVVAEAEGLVAHRHAVEARFQS